MLAVPTGLEPATSGLTGRRELQTSPRDQMKLISTPNGIRTRAATLKGWCPRPLDDGGRASSTLRAQAKLAPWPSASTGGIRLQSAAGPSNRGRHGCVFDREAIWLVFVTFVFISVLMMLFSVIVDLFRDDSLSGWGKAGWIIVLIAPAVPRPPDLRHRPRQGDGRPTIKEQVDTKQSFDDYVRTVSAEVQRPSSRRRTCCIGRQALRRRVRPAEGEDPRLMRRAARSSSRRHPRRRTGGAGARRAPARPPAPTPPSSSPTASRRSSCSSSRARTAIADGEPYRPGPRSTSSSTIPRSHCARWATPTRS